MLRLPRWSAPAAAVAAVLSLVAWTAGASAGDSTAVTVVTAITAVVFWLALMVLAAALVQRAVGRYRDRDDG